MKCTGTTNLEGLRYPSKYLAIPNEQEELFIVGWEAVKDQVNKLSDKAWVADKKGNAKTAASLYKGANIFFYLIHLGINIRNFMKKEGTLDNECLKSLATKKYKLDCVKDNLQCLSKKYCTNYVSAWDLIQLEFGIFKSPIDCVKPCCPGIGEMIIDDNDDCLAFIIGDCKFEEECDVSEFKLNEFVEAEIPEHCQTESPNI